MARIITSTCKVCGKYTSYLMGDKDGSWICRWCVRKRQIEAGVKNPIQLPNLYLD